MSYLAGGESDAPSERLVAGQREVGSSDVHQLGGTAHLVGAQLLLANDGEVWNVRNKIYRRKKSLLSLPDLELALFVCFRVGATGATGARATLATGATLATLATLATGATGATGAETLA